MTAADVKRFSELLASLVSLYGDSIGEARAEMYFAALSDLSIEQIEEAIKLAIRTHTFLPKPAELRACLPSTIPDLGEAWAELRRAQMQWRPGRPTGQTVSPFVAMLAERLGGWSAMSCLSEEAAWHRARAAYPALKAAAVARGGDPRGMLLGVDEDAERLKLRAQFKKITGGKKE